MNTVDFFIFWCGAFCGVVAHVVVQRKREARRNTEIAELREQLRHEFSRGMRYMSLYSMGCQVCRTMAWKVNAHGKPYCDHCGEVFNPDAVPETWMPSQEVPR